MKNREDDARTERGLTALGLIFALSGAAALSYQIVWQRMLFLVFGVDMEAVTVVVSVFMLGLGIGGALGGALADRWRAHCVPLFCAFELVIGLFGLASHALIGSLHGAEGLLWVGIQTAGLLLLPTTLMGATLPLLSVAIVARGKRVGEAVGLLYYFNTLGAALACLALGMWFFNHFGLQQALWVACAMNVTAAALGGWVWRRW